MTSTRACSRCLVVKPRDPEHFLYFKRSADGFSYQCRDCHRAYRQRWRAERAGQWPSATERRISNPVREAARSLRRSVSERCRTTGIVCAPELRARGFILAWLIRQPTCECCGVAFDMGPKHGTFDDASPSLDRFDASGGYTLENTSLICWRCNNIKRDYVEQDLRRVADWMERRRDPEQINRISWKEASVAREAAE